ncbi:MAG: cytochrome ubiquinol oxidase subunit I [Desulfobacterales bacterium]
MSYKDINAEVKGLKDFPRDERPNVLITSFAFKGMVGLGTLFVVLTSWGMIRRKKLTQSPMFLKIMMLSLPLPYLANELGWILTEVGRQPWVAYGLLRITDGGSTLPSGQVFVSLMGFVLVYGMLGALAFFLMARYAKKGPTS